MGWRITQQPNGLLARFSEVVDDFTHYDMTRDEAIRMCMEEMDMGRKASIDKVQRGVDAGHERFESDLDTIKVIHGARRADKRRAMLSKLT